ncbi:MAG: MATE family efflux transporter [Phycisphaerae bacterium]|nr:MATE family efflux transporter [Phycisphaerae bacterium]
MPGQASAAPVAGVDPTIGLAARLTPSTIHWSVLGLALPALLDQALQTLLLLSDMYLAGHLEHGKDMLAAVGMAGQLMMVISVLFTAIGVGAMALVARSIGAGDQEHANSIARQAMLLGVAVGTATAAAMVTMAPWVFHALGLRGDTLAAATTFCRIFMPGLCVGALMSMGGACLRGAGDTRGALMAAGLANIVNIAVAWTLVHGWMVLPVIDSHGFGGWRHMAPMGLRGIAIGTLSAYVVGGLFMLHLVRTGRRGIRVRFRPLDFQADLIGRIIRIGAFAGMESFIFACASTAIAAIVNHPPLGTADYSAFVLTVRVEAISYLPGFAFGIAGGALVGQSLGAGLPRQAGHCGWWAYAWGGLVMGLVGVVFVLWPERLIHLFLDSADSAEVAAKAVHMLRICGYVQPFLAMIMVFSGCLKGAGDTRYPFAITLVGVLLLRIPGTILAARAFRLGIVGVWLVMMSDLTLRGLAVALRFLHGGWKKVRV